jgi:dTDP-4-dehydrorhamnose 3,5-epimerase
VDLRPNSPTYLKTFEVELNLRTHRQLYVPPGIAHGFQTLEDETEVFYEIGETFSPEHARGVRWNDPAFKIQFPLPVTVISEKDQRYADYLP